MITKIRVVCPHCRAEQDEAESAISTFCRSCGRHFAIQGAPRKKTGKLPKTSRLIRCRQCGVENKVVPAAQSTQCVNCVAYMDLRHHEITGVSTETLSTYGDIFFAPGSSYRGGEVLALRVRVAGRVNARVTAEEEIEITANGNVYGAVEAPTVRVLRNAQGDIGTIKTQSLHVGGNLSTQSAVVSQKLHVHSGGGMSAKRVQAGELHVEEGGSFSVQRFEILPPDPQTTPPPFQLESEDPTGEPAAGPVQDKPPAAE
jgi:cytoskeletal protein CcmA (bactofilin family)